MSTAWSPSKQNSTSRRASVRSWSAACSRPRRKRRASPHRWRSPPTEFTCWSAMHASRKQN